MRRILYALDVRHIADDEFTLTRLSKEFDAAFADSDGTEPTELWVNTYQRSVLSPAHGPAWETWRNIPIKHWAKPEDF